MKRLLLTLLLLLPGLAAAQSWPEARGLYVNDLADIIDEAAEARLVTRLETLKAETGIEAVVATFYTRMGLGEEGQSVAEFAKGLFDHWGVGNAETNDGILMVVVSEEHEMYIQLGQAYGAKYNTEAEKIVSGVMLPAFREGEMVKGIEDGAEALDSRIARPYHAATRPAPAAESPAAAPAAEPEGESKGGGNGLVWIGGIIAAIAALIGGASFARRNKPCPECGKKGLKYTRRVLEEATVEREGKGESVTTCPHCGWTEAKPFTIAKLKAPEKEEHGGGKSGQGGAGGKW